MNPLPKNVANIIFIVISPETVFSQFSGPVPGTIFYDEPSNVPVQRDQTLVQGDILMRGESV